MQIRSASNICRVLIGRGKNIWLHLGTFQANFLWTDNIDVFLSIFFGGLEEVHNPSNTCSSVTMLYSIVSVCDAVNPVIGKKANRPTKSRSGLPIGPPRKIGNESLNFTFSPPLGTNVKHCPTRISRVVCLH